MDEIWKNTLSLPNLPKKLASRRNLHAHFSKFGEVKDVSVNKDNRSGLIEFASRTEAKAAKNLGKLFEGKPLRILWFQNTLEDTEKILDPRASEPEDIVEVDNLWEYDDKECFGVEKEQPAADKIKRSAKDMISQHLKLSSARESSVIKSTIMSKSENPRMKILKSQPTVSQPKKILINKRKLLRKEGTESEKNKKKTTVKKLSLTIASPEDLDELKLKLALLTERDKLIREKTVPGSNIETEMVIKGTCPDMCPERERLVRQIQKQEAVYECFPGTYKMDENKAVKEYSRSSADQEVPLPHDLRPGPVLSMTMTYLITNIINRIDDPNESMSLWYSFIWSRLRSIRKDIVMQQLCDLDTVTIVEQHARFHITCYDYMWGKVVSGYDDKTNTETLMNCLNSLKHLYEDLKKQNVKCPNAPEFYSYIFLLKLLTGDVFYEYQQLSPEIQQSPQILFAMNVYKAILNNKYSTFFKLVKQASYLEACLMQRKFDEVRTKALKVMSKTYSMRNKNAGLTISFIMKCLKFDSLKNTLTFCEKIEENLMKKIDFEDENEDENISSSSFLIRDKRVPIANAVVGMGNPLPTYTPHQVHTSFDENGQLREPFQTVSDENYDSYDSPLDESVTSIPEGKPQSLNERTPFTFSLSPKATEDNIFRKNVFTRLGTFKTEEDDIINRELPAINASEVKGSKLQVDLKGSFEGHDSLYEAEARVSLRMEEDFNEDMDYDRGSDEKENETRSEKFQLFSPLESIKRSPFAQPLPSVPHMPQKPIINSAFFQGIENQSTNFVPLVKSPESKNEGNFQFSITPKLELPKQFLFKTGTCDNLSSLGRTDQYQSVSSQIKCDNKRENPFLLEQSKITSNVSSHVSIDKEYLQKKQERDKEAELKEKDIMEKILLKKLEEERVRNEEIRRAEIERQKNIKKQKELEKLRKDLTARMKADNARKCLRVWKARVEKLKKKRADFPFLHQLSVENHLELWGRMKFIPATSVFQRAKDKQNLNSIVSNLLTNGINDSCQYIGHELAEMLAKSAARTMDMGSIRPVFWKLAMSFPWKDRSNPKYSVFNKIMKRCCKQTFYKRKDAELGTVESAMTSLQVPVHVSVHFSDDLYSCRGLHGMDALIFVVVEGFESEKTCLDRLRSLVTIHTRSSALSVAVMTISGDRFDRILKLELRKLQEQNLIASWTMKAWTTPNCLLENLSFLTQHFRVEQDVCARPLESLVREAVDDFVYDVDRSQVYCSTLMDALESPNTAINIYNTFLTKLEDLLLSSKLDKYFNFAEEFKSHIPPNECGGPELMCGKQYNNQYKSQIADKINSLKLPELLGWPVHTNQIDFDTLAELLETYCRTQIKDMEVFKQIIRKLAQEVATPSTYLHSYSWLHIVEMWAESRLNHVFSAKERSRKMFVIYNKNDLQQMIKKQWWITLPIVSQAGKVV